MVNFKLEIKDGKFDFSRALENMGWDEEEFEAALKDYIGTAKELRKQWRKIDKIHKNIQSVLVASFEKMEKLKPLGKEANKP
jgi:dsDNA-specific endonuclease/ATPase MutS2